MSLTEKQDEKVQVCETNLVRRIVGVKRADKRRTDELRVEVGVKENVKKKLATNSFDHVLVIRKRWEVKNWQREQMLRKWRGKEGKEDQNCDGGLLNGDLETEGEECRKSATDRRNWRLLIGELETACSLG